MFLLVAGCSQQDTAAAASTTRWQPASDDTVVYELPAAKPGTTPLYQLRQQLTADSKDPVLAANYATAALKAYAGSGDPRLLGYARGVLQPWRETSAPPLDIWLLRARLLQTEHRFDAAARDADALLERYPGRAEALLLAADAWRRAGNLTAARGRCLGLSLAGRPALAQLCAADIQLSLGQPQLALSTAHAAIANGRTELEDTALAWAYAVHAEAATATGNIPVALDSWDKAFAATQQPSLATHLGRVDTLLEAQRFTDALQHLDNLPAADAVLLRRAIAGAALQHTDLASWQDQLNRRFNDPAYRDANSLHWRELALYELHVTRDSAAALQFAQRNWQLQKGYEDAELLLRAAATAGDENAARSVTEWRRLQGATS